MSQLSRHEIQTLSTQFGGEWCNCIQNVILDITPELLAAYCESKKYPEQHKVIRDESGVRYGYFLANKVESRTVQGETVEKQFKLMAGFGDYKLRPFETLQSCLKAIHAIAEFEDRSPQTVAEEVILADPQLAPTIPKDQNDERPNGPINAGAKRYIQTPNGIRPA